MFKWITRLVLLAVLLFVVAPLVFMAFALQEKPLLAEQPAPTADDAKRAKALAQKLKDLAQNPDAPDEITVTEADLNGSLAALRRMAPFVRGEAHVGRGQATALLTAEVPVFSSRPFLNVEAAIGPSETGLAVERVSVGGIDIPTPIAMAAARLALDLGLGGGTSDIVFDRLGPVLIDDDQVVATVQLDETDRAAIEGRIKDRLRRLSDTSRSADVAPFAEALTAAAEAGLLPTSGSFVPWVRYTLALAADRADPAAPNKVLQSALAALAIHCGTGKFQIFTGPVVPEGAWPEGPPCARTTLGGRRDLRQHFTVSAGLQAVGSSQSAFAIGEIKELLDTGKKSGFSFDDLAADLAGTRLAETLAGMSPGDWRELGNRMTSEAAVLPSLAGLESGLTEAQFIRAYGGFDDPRYKAKLDDISDRVAGLAVFAR